MGLIFITEVKCAVFITPFFKLHLLLLCYIFRYDSFMKKKKRNKLAYTTEKVKKISNHDILRSMCQFPLSSAHFKCQVYFSVRSLSLISGLEIYCFSGNCSVPTKIHRRPRGQCLSHVFSRSGSLFVGAVSPNTGGQVTDLI